MSDKFPEIEIVSTILCDDIRKEDNGKSILIGVYSGDILLNEFPSHIALSLWVHLRVNKAGEFPFEFRFVGTKGNTVSEIGGGANVKTAGTAVITLPPLPVFLESEGELKVEMKYGESDWALIRSVEVKKKT